jgi:hypothetical protein
MNVVAVGAVTLAVVLSGSAPAQEAPPATLNAYASNREQFTGVLLSFANVLKLQLEYAQTRSRL